MNVSGNGARVMASQLRCWSCDHDLPRPVFSKYRMRQPPGSAPDDTVACEFCGRLYRVGWSPGGWRVVPVGPPVRPPN
jgi:hypothetical protein